MSENCNRLAEIRLIVAHAVGLSPADMADDVEVMTTFAADSGSSRGGSRKREF